MGSGCIDPSVLDLGTTWGGGVSGQLQAPAVLPRGKCPHTSTHWIGGWVDPRAGLKPWRGENSFPYRNSNSDPSVVQPIGSLYPGSCVKL
jgi:hypothetical protein